MKGIKATLRLKSKILEVYKYDDLAEICILDNMENFYQKVDIDGEEFALNLYRPTEVTWEVTLSEILLDGNDYDIDQNSSKKIKLEVSSD